jgi:gliding motility-associated-like protein
MMKTLTHHFPANVTTVTFCKNVLLFIIGFLCQQNLWAQPIFNNFPPNLTVQCDAIPAVVKPTATSICPPVNVAYSEFVTTNMTCPQEKTILRVFTATDNCNMVIKKTQTIVVIDTKPPTITFVAPALIGKKHLDTLEFDCASLPIFDVASATATDNCCPMVVMTFSDNLLKLGDCPKDGYLQFMDCSWIATDACGNKTEIRLFFRIVDKTPPAITSVPKDVTVSCESVNQYTGFQPVIKDACDNSPTIKEDVKTIAGADCPNNYVIERTWTATDKCGNVAKKTQTITVEDKKIPLITGVPADITIQFGQVIPAPVLPKVTDNCSKNIASTLKIFRSMIGCDSLYTYQYTAIDECNNTATAAQKITIIMPKPSAGKLKTDSLSYCIYKDSAAFVLLTETTASVVPKDFTKIFILVDKKTGNVIKNSPVNFLLVPLIGDYTAHVLVYQNNTIDINKIKNVVDFQVITACYSLDAVGFSFNTRDCSGTNTPGCTPPNIAGAIVKNANCGQNDGYIDLKLPTGNFVMLWNNGETKTKIENLTAGTYTVKVAQVTDAKCFTIKTFVVENIDHNIITNANITAADCGKDNGEVVFTDKTFTYTWLDGKKNDTRNDLAEGNYYVTVENANGCKAIKNIAINSKNGLLAKAIINKKPDCASNNGEVTIDVSNGSGDYHFSWKSGATKSTITAGNYAVTVTDKKTNCTTIVDFILLNVVKDSATIDLAVTNGKCAADNGTVKADIKVFNNFLQPFTTKIVDNQGNVYQENNIPSGNYQFLLYNAASCLVANKAFLIQNPASLVVVFDQKEKDCKGDILLQVSGGTSPYTFDWADIAGNNDAQNRIGIAKGNYAVTVADNNNCTIDFATVVSDKTCAVPCKDIVKEKNLVLTTDDCNATVTTCLTLDMIDIVNYTITDNGNPYTGQIKPCKSDTLYNYSYLIFPDTAKVGPYILQSWLLDGKVITSTFDNIKALVDSMNVWNPAGNWTLNTAKYLIEGGSSKHQYGAMTVKQAKSPATATVAPNILQLIKGSSFTFTAGNHQVIFTDKKTNCKDTLTVTVNCTDCKNIYTGSKNIIADSCNALTKICLDVKATDLKNTIIKNNNLLYINQLQSCANGNVALVLPVGNYNFTFSDTITKCEKTFLLDISCKKDTLLKATYITKKLCTPDSLDFCFATAGFTPPFTLKDLCENKVIDAVTYKINNLCVGIKAIAEGKDTLCLLFCDSKQKCDTTYLIVEVCKNKENSKIDTIYKDICLDKPTIVCVGKVSVGDIASVTNICAANTDATIANVVITPKFNCIDVLGKKVGKTRACLQVCSNTGKCDTTILFLNIVDCEAQNERPIAVKDSAFTLMEMPTLVRVLDNDTINGTFVKVDFVTKPLNGTAVVNADNSITYTPDESFCEGIDTFKYFLQNQKGKDTATVCVRVDCESFFIFNAFSPNEDGKNSHFHIRGIEQFPENLVTIYNRWGTLVYQKQSYRNGDGWTGDWNGQIVPDGTYFYVVELLRSKTIYNGFLYIQR